MASGGQWLGIGWAYRRRGGTSPPSNASRGGGGVTWPKKHSTGGKIQIGANLMWTNLETLPRTKCFLWFYGCDVPKGVHWTRAAGSIRDPAGNNGTHPLGSNSEGSDTKMFLDFQGAVPTPPPPNFGLLPKNPQIIPPVVGSNTPPPLGCSRAVVEQSQGM